MAFCFLAHVGQVTYQPSQFRSVASSSTNESFASRLCLTVVTFTSDCPVFLILGNGGTSVRSRANSTAVLDTVCPGRPLWPGTAEVSFVSCLALFLRGDS